MFWAQHQRQLIREPFLPTKNVVEDDGRLAATCVHRDDGHLGEAVQHADDLVLVGQQAAFIIDVRNSFELPVWLLTLFRVDGEFLVILTAVGLEVRSVLVEDFELRQELISAEYREHPEGVGGGRQQELLQIDRGLHHVTHHSDAAFDRVKDVRLDVSVVQLRILVDVVDTNFMDVLGFKHLEGDGSSGRNNVNRRTEVQQGCGQ